MHENEHHAGMGTFILGGLIGAALGILFAPRKGNETRRKLKDWAGEKYHEGKEKVMHHAHEIKDEVMEGAGQLKNHLAEHGRELKDRAGELKDHVMSRAESMKNKMEDEDKTSAHKNK